MQVKMSQLVRVVKSKFEKLGFTYFPHKTSWEGGVFCKKETDGMYLTLGMTKNRFYDCCFTVDMYFSTTTRTPAIWGDIPRKCYIRPGQLLSATDRETLSLPLEPMDIWWDSLDNETIDSLVKSVELSEEKLMSDTELIEGVKHSVDANVLLERALQIIKCVQGGKEFERSMYQFVPEKVIHGIPLECFFATEQYKKEHLEKITKNGMYWDAANAYRMFKLDGLG